MNRAQRKKKIDQRFSSVYSPLLIHGEICFCTPTGRIVMVQEMPGENALVLGHTDNLAEAELYRFEDGDRFYLDEMTETEMFEAMIHEIEG